MRFSNWYEGMVIDARTGDSRMVTNGSSVMPVQIRAHGETDESKYVTVTGYGEYVGNVSPLWVKAKIVRHKSPAQAAMRRRTGPCKVIAGITWGSGARCRSQMVKDEANGWRYFDMASFSYMTLDQIMERLNGPVRITNYKPELTP